MKKIIFILFVFITVVTITGCDGGTGTTEDYEFCTETVVWAGPNGLSSMNMYKYEKEYLKKTGCRKIETCDKTVQLTLRECR